MAGECFIHCAMPLRHNNDITVNRQLRKLDERRQRVDGRRLLRRRGQDDAVPSLRLRHQRVHVDARHTVGPRLRSGVLVVSHPGILLWWGHHG